MFCISNKISGIRPINIISFIRYPFSGTKRHQFAKHSALLTKRYRFKPRKCDLNKLYDTPVFIISYNRLSYVEQMVQKLKECGMKNIHIIDNDSTYPPLLKYLKTCDATVHYMDKNWGHEVFWRCGKFKKIIRKSIYIVTDPDIEINDSLPVNWLEQMYQILGEYKNITKVGFALRINDVPDFNKNIKDYESQFYKKTIPHDELEMFLANIDTTFALYRPGYYRPGSTEFYCGIRIGGRFVAKHIPWYISTDTESKEDVYYRKHANIKVSNWARVQNVRHKRAKIKDA